MIPLTTSSTSRPVSSPRVRMAANLASKSVSCMSRNCMETSLYMFFQPFNDLSDPLVLGLQTRPVDDQPSGDVGDGLHLHQAVLLEGLAGGNQIDDPLREP